MSNISMVEAKLPPGFRFHPRDEELICDYLMIKVSHDHDHHLRRRHDSPILIEVDLNKSEPWDLPELACVGGKDWYFYSQRDRKYATGLRTNRATATGYWKATGKDRAIHRRGSLVGMRKTLVFYQGRAPKGSKTDWVMHEFRLEGPFGPPKVSITKEDWVLCRMFYKNKDSPSKSSMEGSYDTIGTTMTSLSLPPLTDSYINFKTNQTGPDTTNICHDNDYNHQEQVPCFSIFPTHHTNQTAPNNHIFSSHGFMDHHQLPNTTMAPNKNNMVMMASDASFGGGGAMVGMGGGGNGNGDPFSRDKKVIKAVLDQYFKIESDNNIGGAMKESPTSLGGGDSFLSEVGMPNMLNLY